MAGLQASTVAVSHNGDQATQRCIRDRELRRKGLEIAAQTAENYMDQARACTQGMASAAQQGESGIASTSH